MSDEIKRHADILRATLAVLEILAPFNADDRLTIVIGIVRFSDIGEVVVGRAMPDISGLLEKVKPRPADG